MRSLVPLQGFSEQAVVDSIQETSKGTPSPDSDSDGGVWTGSDYLFCNSLILGMISMFSCIKALQLAKKNTMAPSFFCQW